MIKVCNLLVVGLIWGMPLEAAELRWPATIYSHYSNQEPLKDVLESMASSQAIPVIVSDEVEDVISVSFTEISPAEIFQQLLSAYKLTWYYDGNTLFVYRIDEMQSAVIKLRSITPIKFRESLHNLGVYDSRFRWNADQDQRLIYFSGPPRFVSLVNEMARQLDTGRSKNPNTVYSWIDQNGVTHYSSRAPQNHRPGSVATIELQSTAISSRLEVSLLNNEPDRDPTPAPSP